MGKKPRAFFSLAPAIGAALYTGLTAPQATSFPAWCPPPYAKICKEGTTRFPPETQNLGGGPPARPAATAVSSGSHVTVSPPAAQITITGLPPMVTLP